MKLFKKHKAKEKTILSVGIQECRTCEKNIRCAECFNLKENKVLKEALEKQIPKKVIFQGEFKGLRYCPCCNVRLIGWGMKYCGECGQALDWSDDNA